MNRVLIQETHGIVRARIESNNLWKIGNINESIEFGSGKTKSQYTISKISKRYIHVLKLFPFFLRTGVQVENNNLKIGIVNELMCLIDKTCIKISIYNFSDL